MRDAFVAESPQAASARRSSSRRSGALQDSEAHDINRSFQRSGDPPCPAATAPLPAESTGRAAPAGRRTAGASVTDTSPGAQSRTRGWSGGSCLGNRPPAASSTTPLPASPGTPQRSGCMRMKRGANSTGRTPAYPFAAPQLSASLWAPCAALGFRLATANTAAAERPAAAAGPTVLRIRWRSSARRASSAARRRPASASRRCDLVMKNPFPDPDADPVPAEHFAAEHFAAEPDGAGGGAGAGAAAERWAVAAGSAAAERGTPATCSAAGAKLGAASSGRCEGVAACGGCGGWGFLAGRRAPSKSSNADGFGSATGSALRTGDVARDEVAAAAPNRGSCRMPFTDGRPRLRRCGRPAAPGQVPRVAREGAPDASAPAESGSRVCVLLRELTPGIVAAVAGSAEEAVCAGVAIGGSRPFAAPSSPLSCAWPSPSESRAGSSKIDDIAAQAGRRNAVCAGLVLRGTCSARFEMRILAAHKDVSSSTC